MNKFISSPIKVNAHNVRDLGGYLITDTKQTKYKSFIRASRLCTLSYEDKKFLHDEYNLRCVIDLRLPHEINAHPDNLSEFPDIKHYKFHLSDKVSSIGLSTLLSPMVKMYMDMLENKDTMKQIFSTMAKFENSCVLYHCTAGKDRTGMITMLLLSLAGVDEEYIIKDYAATTKFMTDFYSKKEEDAPKFFFSTQEKYIVKTLALFKEKYINAYEYLKVCGITDKEIEILRKKLV